MTKPNLFLRRDTLFGACQGVADDLGISALWLRVPLAATILYDPKVAVGIYAVLCVVVLATRLIWPAKSTAVAARPVATPAVAAPAIAHNEQREFAQAA